MAALEIALIVALILTLVDRFGYDVLSQKVQDAYMVITGNALVKRHKKLQEERFQLQKELASTSSMDQFAKWARLRRQLDAKIVECDTASRDIGWQKAKLGGGLAIGLRVLVYLMQIATVFTYRNSGMFFLPSDWTGMLSSWLSFPFAPAGSLGTLVWMSSCRKVFSMALKGLEDGEPPKSGEEAGAPASESSEARKRHADVVKDLD